MYSFKILSRETTFCDITEMVRNSVAQERVVEGLCVVGTTELGASIALLTKNDAAVHLDLVNDLARIFPSRKNYYSSVDSDLISAYTKTSLLGSTIDLIITEGKLFLGKNQNVFLINLINKGGCYVNVKCIGYKSIFAKVKEYQEK